MSGWLGSKVWRTRILSIYQAYRKEIKSPIQSNNVILFGIFYSNLYMCMLYVRALPPDSCDIGMPEEMDFHLDWIPWGFMHLLLVILNMSSIREICLQGPLDPPLNINWVISEGSEILQRCGLGTLCLKSWIVFTKLWIQAKCSCSTHPQHEFMHSIARLITYLMKAAASDYYWKAPLRPTNQELPLQQKQGLLREKALETQPVLEIL